MGLCYPLAIPHRTGLPLRRIDDAPLRGLPDVHVALDCCLSEAYYGFLKEPRSVPAGKGIQDHSSRVLYLLCQRPHKVVMAGISVGDIRVKVGA